MSIYHVGIPLSEISKAQPARRNDDEDRRDRKLGRKVAGAGIAASLGGGYLAGKGASAAEQAQWEHQLSAIRDPSLHGRTAPPVKGLKRMRGGLALATAGNLATLTGAGIGVRNMIANEADRAARRGNR